VCKLNSEKYGSADYKKLTAVGRKTFQNIIRHDLCPVIARIFIPTLLIFGARDKSTPIYMAKVWTKLGKCTKLQIYKGSGHFCYITERERFIIDTNEFLKGKT
jgi:pimeloyl-ACP methyl ester carboxylesterase